MKCVKQTHRSEKNPNPQKTEGEICREGGAAGDLPCCGWWPGDHPCLAGSRGMWQPLGSGCCARLLLPPCTNTPLQPALGSVSSRCDVCCGGELFVSNSVVVLVEGYISVCSIIPFYLRGLTSLNVVSCDVHLSPN